MRPDIMLVANVGTRHWHGRTGKRGKRAINRKLKSQPSGARWRKCHLQNFARRLQAIQFHRLLSRRRCGRSGTTPAGPGRTPTPPPRVIRVRTPLGRTPTSTGRKVTGRTPGIGIAAPDESCPTRPSGSTPNGQISRKRCCANNPRPSRSRGRQLRRRRFRFVSAAPAPVAAYRPRGFQSNSPGRMKVWSAWRLT